MFSISESVISSHSEARSIDVILDSPLPLTFLMPTLAPVDPQTQSLPGPALFCTTKGLSSAGCTSQSPLLASRQLGLPQRHWQQTGGQEKE